MLESDLRNQVTASKFWKLSSALQLKSVQVDSCLRMLEFQKTCCTRPLIIHAAPHYTATGQSHTNSKQTYHCKCWHQSAEPLVSRAIPHISVPCFQFDGTEAQVGIRCRPCRLVQSQHCMCACNCKYYCVDHEKPAPLPDYSCNHDTILLSISQTQHLTLLVIFFTTSSGLMHTPKQAPIEDSKHIHSLCNTQKTNSFSQMRKQRTEVNVYETSELQVTQQQTSHCHFIYYTCNRFFFMDNETVSHSPREERSFKVINYQKSSAIKCMAIWSMPPHDANSAWNSQNQSAAFDLFILLQSKLDIFWFNPKHPSLLVQFHISCTGCLFPHLSIKF